MRGEVRVQPTSDFAAERLQSPGTKWVPPWDVLKWVREHHSSRWIQPQAQGLVNRGGQQLKQLESLGGRPHVYKGHSLWILRFKGIDKPEEVSSTSVSRQCSEWNPGSRFEGRFDDGLS